MRLKKAKRQTNLHRKSPEAWIWTMCMISININLGGTTKSTKPFKSFQSWNLEGSLGSVAYLIMEERYRLSDIVTQRTQNPGTEIREEKPKLVVIMGPTGSGKSKLAVDLGTHFPIEVINADSMQVYHGLDVLTNKVPLTEQKGSYSIYLYPFLPLWNILFFLQFLIIWLDLLVFVGVPHHLLGTVSPHVEFTAKQFRDSTIPVSFKPLFLFLLMCLFVRYELVMA